MVFIILSIIVVGIIGYYSRNPAKEHSSVKLAVIKTLEAFKIKFTEVDLAEKERLKKIEDLKLPKEIRDSLKDIRSDDKDFIQTEFRVEIDNTPFMISVNTHIKGEGLNTVTLWNHEEFSVISCLYMKRGYRDWYDIAKDLVRKITEAKRSYEFNESVNEFQEKQFSEIHEEQYNESTEEPIDEAEEECCDEDFSDRYTDDPEEGEFEEIEIPMDDDESTQYLNVLELKQGASKMEIRKAYIRLSKVYHPDVNKSKIAKIKMQEIVEAYNILKAS